MGRILIPRIGVDMTMYEGVRMTTLDHGPGHWPGSALPGSKVGLYVSTGQAQRTFQQPDPPQPNPEPTRRGPKPKPTKP